MWRKKNKRKAPEKIVPRPVPKKYQRVKRYLWKTCFYTMKYGLLALVHIVPITVGIVILLKIGWIYETLVMGINAIFDTYYRTLLISRLITAGLQILIYVIIALLIWIILWFSFLRRFFKTMYIEMDGIPLKEGRVWWYSPNKITKILKKLADKGGIKYEEKRYLLYRTRHLINPFAPLKSVNKLLFYKDIEDEDIKFDKYSITLKNVTILRYKEDYVATHKYFASKKIDTKKLERIIYIDAKKIGKTVGEYALANVDVRLSNVKSTLFFITPKNLEVKEHIDIGSQDIAFKTLRKLVDRYDEVVFSLYTEGALDSDSISKRVLPIFNQILKYSNTIKAKYDYKDLPEPPNPIHGMVTWEDIESYVNKVKYAVELYENESAFKGEGYVGGEDTYED